MADVFMTVLNMSISACVLICLILLLRAASGKAPKRMRCCLWILVAFRLICPFVFESDMSIIPKSWHVSLTEKNNETVYDEPAYYEPGVALENEIDSEDEVISVPDVIPAMQSVSENVKAQEEDAESSDTEPGIADAVKPASDHVSGSEPASAHRLSMILTIVWLIGLCGMLGYYIVSSISLKKKLKTAVPIRVFEEQHDIGSKNNIYVSDEVKTPFILGIIRPKIYLPSSLDIRTMENVLAHEKKHLHRRDNIWKLLGFMVLSVHWFNPLVWLSYFLFIGDVEAACDEAVISNKTSEEIREYATALLECSIHKENPVFCSLAFGEVSVKRRIKDISEYKKPRLKIGIALIVIAAMITACTMSEPTESVDNAGQDPSQTVLVANDEQTGEPQMVVGTKGNDDQAGAPQMVVGTKGYDEQTGEPQIVVGTKPADESEKVPEDSIYKAILYGDAEFYCYDSGTLQTVTINDVPALFNSDPYSRIYEYAVVDLDRDGNDEVVLNIIATAGDAGGKLILHQIDDKVYGYKTDYKRLQSLKKDGTYEFQGWSLTWDGFAQIAGFDEYKFTEDVFTYESGSYEGADTYVVDHVTSTEGAFADAKSAQFMKTNTVWNKY
ncbi:MAG: hypothetical protein J5372_04255 [Lachnospiraceae bacterium]|nr:hypothetical protein [Lachnospiraceae bacterium]